VCGLVDSVRQILTKMGDKMAFIAIEDRTDEGEIIVFPKTYADIAEKLAPDVFIKVTGKVSSTNASGQKIEDAKIIADKVEIIEK